jgi:hypothetical protein
VLPPRIAPTLAAIIPIFKTEDEHKSVGEACVGIAKALCGDSAVTAAQRLQGSRDILNVAFGNQIVLIDGRDNRPGDKHFHWEQRGVPFRTDRRKGNGQAGRSVP